ncbi:MAG: hypothetical protein HY791_14685 [Deltaproteobacteria bacterium]|nr:hypothetical protein [Deltaproteobacteria bacterium]
MLDAYIIEEIKRQERQRRDDRPRLEIEIPRPERPRPEAPQRERDDDEESDEDRGDDNVIRIQL